jgi:hypothetical protein
MGAVVGFRMSNAHKTSRTIFIGARVPRELVDAIDAAGMPRTQAIVAALRKAWDMPEPNAAETAIADRIVDARAQLDSGR